MSSSRPVALITNATGYVGPALGRTLAERGFDLVLHGADSSGSMVGVEESFEDQARALDRHGATVETVTGVDLTSAEGNAELVSRALDRFGRLDSACLVTGTIVVGRFLDSTEEQWERIKRTNLDMVFHGLRAVLPPMVEAASGQVVVFTSSTGARPGPMTAIYGGTRAGANGIVRAVGLEHAADGIQVNAVGTNYMGLFALERGGGFLSIHC
ncbi:SDR family NAD(P)-dependent oxidoreductase [Ilumatobacter sp.]|uniref:SDR family NAD(P)-dependent oxidoreductase n=1 Tax=Ilumatobacter sp. TaxID=1967498 RepID=UPI003B51ABB0